MVQLSNLTTSKLEEFMLLQNWDVGVLFLVAGDPGKEYITTIFCHGITTLNIQDVTTFRGIDREKLI